MFNNTMFKLPKLKNIFILRLAVLVFLSGLTLNVYAEGGTLGGKQSLGQVATQLTSSFAKVTKLITGLSYVLGIGFALSAIFKFKQHKDNPTQIPIGTPIALLAVAAAMLFLPNVLEVTGQTLFAGGKVASPTGQVIS